MVDGETGDDDDVVVGDTSIELVLVGVIELYVPKIVFDPIMVETYVTGGKVVVKIDVIVNGESRV